jgi:hypothetical protein
MVIDTSNFNFSSAFFVKQKTKNFIKIVCKVMRYKKY